MGIGVDILLVEDDPNDVELTLRAFQAHKVANRVHVARDGEEALEYIFGSPGKPVGRQPKFILLDLKLPKIGGLEVLKRLKNDPATQGIPVVILTSSREAPDLKAAYEYGVNSYLCKPVEFNDFVDVVKQVGFYWLLLNEPLPA